MSLLRVGILVALVVAVLPADKEQQSALYDRAANAVHWTATFCDRNGQTCTQAATLWSAFVTKAQFGAQMAYELASKYSGQGEDYLAPVDVPFVDEVQRQGTLKPLDLQPAWRGSGRSGA